MEEGLLAKNHGCKHGTQGPQIERVVVLLVVYKQFGALEIAGSNTDIVLGSGVVELGQAPVNQPQLWQQKEKKKENSKKC